MIDIDTITKAIREEIRMCGMTSEPMTSIPPRSDVDAERTVLGAMLAREASPAAYLSADHFYIKLHSWIFSQMSKEDWTIETLAIDAEQIGLPIAEVRLDIQVLEMQPWAGGDNVVLYASNRIVEAADARRLVDLLERVMLAVKTGQRTVKQARLFLGTLDGEVE